MNVQITSFQRNFEQPFKFQHLSRLTFPSNSDNEPSKPHRKGGLLTLSQSVIRYRIIGVSLYSPALYVVLWNRHKKGLGLVVDAVVSIVSCPCQIWLWTSNLTLSPYLGWGNLFREESIPRMRHSCLARAIFGGVRRWKTKPRVRFWIRCPFSGCSSRPWVIDDTKTKHMLWLYWIDLKIHLRGF